jgi:hypothetical protein
MQVSTTSKNINGPGLPRYEKAKIFGINYRVLCYKTVVTNCGNYLQCILNGGKLRNKFSWLMLVTDASILRRELQKE